jgi:hypothetical protein
MRSWRTLDAAAAWGLVLLGCVHNFVAAPMAYEEVSQRLFWFVGAGLALWYAGALNLVRRSAPGSRTARVASVLANVTLLAFVVAFGAYTGALRQPSGILLVAVVLAATSFSILPRALMSAGSTSRT